MEQQGQQQQGNMGYQQQGGENQGEEQEQQFYEPRLPQEQQFYDARSDIYGYPLNQGWVPPPAAMNQYAPPPPMYYGYQYPLPHMEGVPLPPGIPGLGGSTDPLEAVLGPFPCVRLRNLPYDTSLEDILVFFQGLVLIDVVLVDHGDAFVIFANPMDFQMALQRNRQTIGRRFVDISAASRADYYEAVAAQHEQERGLKIRASGSGALSSGGAGMSQRDSGMAGGDDPQQSGESSATSSVTGLWSSGGDPSGPPHSFASGSGGPTSAYDSSMAAQHLAPGGAMLPLARTNSGGSGSVGRVGPPGSSRGGLHAPLQKRTGGGIQVGEHTGFLRMRGLPFSAAKDDIIHFFAGYKPVPESVVLTYRNDGRATGEAYVGFESPDGSKRAMALHRRMMGNRYIELFISNKDEQGRALARFGNR